jgi:hypothetical protein
MWLTVWQQNNTVFRDNSVKLKFVPNASSPSLAAWARKWMHRSLVAGELKSHEEEPIMEVLEVVANPRAVTFSRSVAQTCRSPIIVDAASLNFIPPY